MRTNPKLNNVQRAARRERMRFRPGEAIPEAKVFSASTPELCRQMMSSQQFQFILLDISFGPGDSSGLTLLPEFRKAQPDAKIIMLSTHDDQVTMVIYLLCIKRLF